MNIESLQTLFQQAGPLTGAEIIERTQGEPLELWRLCHPPGPFVQEIVGRRYLRLDQQVEGFARLSPSIRREFLTYTVTGLPGQAGAVQARANDLRASIQRIGQAKTNLARESMAMALSSVPEQRMLLEQACLMIAGDITYGMAHAVPRPESSTGQMVRGSDLDIVVVVEDTLPAGLMKAMDDAIYRQKHFLLAHPDYREEVDYLVKPFAKVAQQAGFNNFKDMVACKILDEAQLLYGSPFVFQKVKELLHTHGIPARLQQLAEQASLQRQQAEASLLNRIDDPRKALFNRLFYTQEESEEIY